MSLRTSIAAALTTAAISLAMTFSVQAQTSVKQNVTPLPARNIYGLTSDNSIYVLRTTATQWARLGRIGVPGNIIGIDFRPADNNANVMYALSDDGTIYQVNVATNPLGVTRVSQMNPRYTGGLNNLMDFNPVANALRVAGGNDQNLAVVNGTDGSNLSSTVAQTRFTYAAGDQAAGQDPEIVGGAYTNNFAGATTTLFYAIDHARNTLVTISTLTATGSSNTGGGQFSTCGPLTNANGGAMDMPSSVDMDIYTDGAGRDFLVGVSERLLFAIDLSTVNCVPPVGRPQSIVVRRGAPGTQLAAGSPSFSGALFDIAIPSRAQ